MKFDWGLVSGGTDVNRLLGTARVLARADALLAFEGNNEPNNWGVTYQNEKGGGSAPSWLAVASCSGTSTAPSRPTRYWPATPSGRCPRSGPSATTSVCSS